MTVLSVSTDKKGDGGERKRERVWGRENKRAHTRVRESAIAREQESREREGGRGGERERKR